MKLYFPAQSQSIFSFNFILINMQNCIEGLDQASAFRILFIHHYEAEKYNTRHAAVMRLILVCTVFKLGLRRLRRHVIRMSLQRISFYVNHPIEFNRETEDLIPIMIAIVLLQCLFNRYLDLNIFHVAYIKPKNTRRTMCRISVPY